MAAMWPAGVDALALDFGSAVRIHHARCDRGAGGRRISARRRHTPQRPCRRSCRHIERYVGGSELDEWRSPLTSNPGFGV